VSRRIRSAPLVGEETPKNGVSACFFEGLQEATFLAKRPGVDRAFLLITFAAGSLSELGQYAGGRLANVALRHLHVPCPWHGRPCRDVRLRNGAP
jgi:hypothetical protein